MDNPIRFSDLFSTDLNSGLQGLIDKVGEVETALMNMLKQVKAEAIGRNWQGQQVPQRVVGMQPRSTQPR